MSAFLNSKCLKTSNKRTHIPLFINQFVSLIEQDVAIGKLLNVTFNSNVNFNVNTCKF